MNTKLTLTLAVAATLAMVVNSSAAPRTWSKATGNYDDSMSQRPTASVRRTYRSVTPRVIEETPAAEAMATAPSTTRRFSYEPSESNGHCDSAQAATKVDSSERTAQAPSNVRSTRRYSYEPSPVGTYSVPRTRSSGPSPNSLPKSDPRRYNF